MQIMPWSPFGGLTKAEKQLSKVLDDSLAGDFWKFDVPGVDMYVEAGQLVVETSLPEYAEQEVEITAVDGALEIKAERQAETEKTNRKYIMRQRSTASSWRRVVLPEEAQADKATASFEKGVLRITMPIADLPEPKKIAITAQVENKA